MGNKPNKLLQKIYNQVNIGSEFLDLGCGRGRDSLFMAEKGFGVTAVDNSQEGINKIKEYIQNNNLPQNKISLFCQDIITFDIEENKYTIINAFNSLQFLPKQETLKVIEKIKRGLVADGYVAISGFTVDDPLYKKLGNQNKCFFESMELKNLFTDFKIILYEEKSIDDICHPGCPEPHKHYMVKMIAQK